MKTDPYEEISFLTSSPNRIEILQLLAEEPGRQTDLQDRSGLSRSTIYRALNKMEGANWVEQDTDGYYTLTFTGRLLSGHYNTFESSVAQLADKEEFFNQLQNHDIEIPLEVLEHSELTVATEEDPHVVIDNFRVASELDVDQFFGILPVVSPIFNQHARTILEKGTEMELIIDEPVLDTSQKNYSEDLELALHTSSFELLVHPTPIDIGLAVFDNKHALFGAFNDRGQLNAGLTGNNQILIDWVKDEYQRYRDEAVPIGDYS